MKIGIDLGGSHVGIGLISDSNELIETRHIDFQNSNTIIDLNEIKNIIKENIRVLLKNRSLKIEDINKIGVAAPGVPTEDKIERIVNLRLDNISIYDLMPEFKGKNITIHNDGKCAAVAEKLRGSLIEEKDCIFLCLGTGIGSGVFLNGKLLKPRKSSWI